MKVISVNKGPRTKVKWANKTVETGIFKSPTSMIQLGFEDVVGDSVVNRLYHGGAVSYTHLRAHET